VSYAAAAPPTAAAAAAEAASPAAADAAKRVPARGVGGGTGVQARIFGHKSNRNKILNGHVGLLGDYDAAQDKYKLTLPGGWTGWHPAANLDIIPAVGLCECIKPRHPTMLLYPRFLSPLSQSPTLRPYTSPLSQRFLSRCVPVSMVHVVSPSKVLKLS